MNRLSRILAAAAALLALAWMPRSPAQELTHPCAERAAVPLSVLLPAAPLTWGFSSACTQLQPGLAKKRHEFGIKCAWG